MALSENEREQFLAEPHVAALSVANNSERGPLTVPIWYLYSPGGSPWILTGKGSKKAQLIESAVHFSLMAQRLEPTIRYVSVEGSVDKIVPGTDEMLVEVSRRYLTPDKVDGYLDFARSQLGEQVAIYMKPHTWLSADLGAL